MPKVQQTSAAPRLGRSRRVATSLAEINVVPLVDVMLVLLIIFMVTAPMIQRGMDVKLPVSRRATQIEGERIFITVPVDYAKTGMVYIGPDAIHVQALAERVRQKMEDSSQKQAFLQADGGVLYKDLYDVIDRLKDAGVENVGIVAKAPGEK